MQKQPAGSSQQPMDVLKKWKKLAVVTKENSKKGLKNNGVPKGSLAVCVGHELKRYVIPTCYLHHEAFGVLLRGAEEEYGFEQAGVLRIPCSVAEFERVLARVERKEGLCYGSLELETQLANCNLHDKLMCR